MRWALLIYGALNAILYAGLTPLWEGFDEPFHYGYVQHLREARSLPVLGRTTLSEEIWRSFPLAPASHVVRHNLPMVTTFDDWFRLPREERLSRHRSLYALDSGLATVGSNAPNYEFQQAPLAYALLMPFDQLWSSLPLPARVWRLRLICALACTLAAGLLVDRLAQCLGLDERSRNAAVFLVFCSQMFYATAAHVANDWLALPLFLLVLNAALALYERPGRAALLVLALALAAGLLTKAYFLAMVPFAFGIVLWRCARREWIIFAAAVLAPAAPWYVRNVTMYGSLTGQQEYIGGVPARAVLGAAFHLPWGRSLFNTARSSLWEGNNSATTISLALTCLMLLLLAAGVAYYLRTRPPGREWVLLAGLACFAAALVYNNVLEFHFTRGAGFTPAPWYVQLLVGPGMCLLLAGMERGGRAGRLLRTAMCCLWTYVICATYFVKLIPQYAGYGGRPGRVIEIAAWYGGSLRQINDMLATTALISPAAILALAASVAVCAVALCWRISIGR